MGSSATAIIAWGVNFNQGEYDEIHESVRPLVDADEDEPVNYNNVLDGTEWENEFDVFLYGYYGDGDDERLALLLKRSKEDAKPTMPAEVDPGMLYPPDHTETVLRDRVLDHMGFTGDRTWKLLLLAEYG